MTESERDEFIRDVMENDGTTREEAEALWTLYGEES